MKAKILILSGFAGSGKGTVCSIARQKEPRLKLSVSMTTRAPREGETDGVEYTFVTREGFQKTLEEGGFLEHAEYSGNRYGTPVGQFNKMIRAGFIPVLEIETKGAELAMEKLEDYVSVFLSPPSYRELEARLRKRGTETEEQIQRRLKEARETELFRIPHYHYLIVNRQGEQEACADAILDLIRSGETNSPALVRDKEAFIASFCQ